MIALNIYIYIYNNTNQRIAKLNQNTMNMLQIARHLNDGCFKIAIFVLRR
jgi:hypothetical protein